MLTLTQLSLKESKDFKDPLALFAFEGGSLAGVSALSNTVKKDLLARAKDEGFTGKSGETVSLRCPDGEGERRFVLVGLGKRKGFDADTLRRASGSLYKRAARFERIGVAAFDDPGIVAEGLLLASHAFTKYADKAKDRKLNEVRFLVQRPAERKKIEKGIDQAKLYAEAVFWTRDIVNTGPSDKSPETLMKAAKALTGAGVTLKVIDKAEAKKLGMGSFLGVSRGSAGSPYFLHLK